MIKTQMIVLPQVEKLYPCSYMDPDREKMSQKLKNTNANTVKKVQSSISQIKLKKSSIFLVRKQKGKHSRSTQQPTQPGGSKKNADGLGRRVSLRRLVGAVSRDRF